jgi:hypothetical protein
MLALPLPVVAIAFAVSKLASAWSTPRSKSGRVAGLQLLQQPKAVRLSASSPKRSQARRRALACHNALSA